MKVIHYIASVDKKGGGTTEYMRLLSSALKNDLSLMIATGTSEDPIVIEGVPIQFFNTSLLRWRRLLKEFKSFLVHEKPDIVHINGIWSPQNWGFQKVAQELHIKVILSPHGMLEPWILQNNPWKKKIALYLFQKQAIQKADFLHATAQMEKDSIRGLGFSNAIRIIPNGIDLSEITRAKEVYGTKKIIFLSRIHPKKGIEILLEAWNEMDSQDWTLEIAGNGDTNYIQSLRDMAQYMKNVHFVGPQYGKDKWDFLRSADLMVLPTHSENFGIVVAEALAVGLPVLTTRGTPWEDLHTHECGYWIDLSVENIKSTLVEVLGTPTKSLKIMGLKGQRLIQEKYDIQQIAKNINRFYNEIKGV